MQPQGPTNARARNKALLAILVTTFVATAPETSLTPALPEILGNFPGAVPSDRQWVVDWFLVPSVLLLIAGVIADRVGRRKMLLWGIGLTAVGAAVSALTPWTSEEIAQVMVGRFVGGLGAIAMLVGTLSTLVWYYPEKLRRDGVGYWAAAFSLAVVFGPGIGGTLADELGWESLFWAQLPALALAFVLTRVWVRDTRDDSPPPADWLGAVLSGMTLVPLTWALIEGRSKGWDDRLILAAFGASVLALLAFICWEARRKYPMLDVRTFLRPAAAASAILQLALFASLGGMLIVVMHFVQVQDSYTPAEAGWAATGAIAAGLIPGSVLTLLLGKWGISRRTAAAPGLIIAPLGMAVLGTAGPDTHFFWSVAILMCVIGFGFGLAMGPLTETIMEQWRPAQAGIAAGVNEVLRLTGVLLGVAVWPGIWDDTFKGSPSLAGQAIADAAWWATAALLPGVVVMWFLPGRARRIPGTAPQRRTRRRLAWQPLAVVEDLAFLLKSLAELDEPRKVRPTKVKADNEQLAYMESWNREEVIGRPLDPPDPRALAKRRGIRFLGRADGRVYGIEFLRINGRRGAEVWQVWDLPADVRSGIGPASGTFVDLGAARDWLRARLEAAAAVVEDLEERAKAALAAPPPRRREIPVVSCSLTEDGFEASASREELRGRANASATLCHIELGAEDGDENYEFLHAEWGVPGEDGEPLVFVWRGAERQRLRHATEEELADALRELWRSQGMSLAEPPPALVASG